MICPCGSTKEYSQCCEPYHRGTPAPTAEALMRSRYSAFVLENEEYLLSTWDPRTRPPRVEFQPDIEWTGLEILKTVKGGLADTMGMVHFKAHFKTADGRGAQEERSKFLRPESGAPWIFVD
ncbi:MAG: YchJ family metal-binding protein [Actinomycetaceae bacterium]|nr:YchJ family metal-binding protein [Actinomycetaceae bacterium]